MESLLAIFYTTNEEKKRLELIDNMYLDYEFYLSLILNNIMENKELRNNAYILNVLAKKKKVSDYLKLHFSRQHYQILVSDNDPKTRKNTYALMGNLVNPDYVLDLIKALKEEKTNYCISSLILSLGNYKIKNIDEILEQYLLVLKKKYENKEIEEVHYNQILESINKVSKKNENFIKHEFKGFNEEVNLYLTCMKPLINASYSAIKKVFNQAIKYKDGVLIKTNDLNKVYTIRTFYEALIVYKKGDNLQFEEVLNNIKEFLNSDFLFKCHQEGGVFNYRIEFISEVNKQEKLNVYEKVSEVIDKSKYLNNPSNYEFSIRIIDNKGSYDIFYKLYTFVDKRFSYRLYDLPASINPVSSAILLKEIEPYLKDNAKVLDPFCGTGTMLIERSYLTSCSLTGVDISNKAIEYALANSKKAKVKINLFKQNCLDHQGYYDEIVANMPYGNRVGNHQINEKLYKAFINKLPTLLLEKGVAFLLTSEISLIKGLIKANKSLNPVKDIYMETGGLTPHLFVIKKV